MKDDGYSLKTASTEVYVLETLERQFFLLDVKRSEMTCNDLWCTYSRTKQLAFIDEFQQKREIFHAKEIEAICYIVSGLLQSPPKNISRPLRLC
jgi:hypothetical protein